MRMICFVGIALLFCALRSYAEVPAAVERWKPLVIQYHFQVWGHYKHVARIGVMIEKESGGNPRAVSPVGAKGLLQFMPATWRDMQRQFGVKAQAFDVDANIYLSNRYLYWLESAFKRTTNACARWQAVLASYNWGIGNVKRAMRKAEWLARAPKETRNYVPGILQRELTYLKFNWKGQKVCYAN